jgi:hypothetical protein
MRTITMYVLYLLIAAATFYFAFTPQWQTTTGAPGQTVIVEQAPLGPYFLQNAYTPIRRLDYNPWAAGQLVDLPNVTGLPGMWGTGTNLSLYKQSGDLRATPEGPLDSPQPIRSIPGISGNMY